MLNPAILEMGGQRSRLTALLLTPFVRFAVKYLGAIPTPGDPLKLFWPDCSIGALYYYHPSTIDPSKSEPELWVDLRREPQRRMEAIIPPAYRDKVVWRHDPPGQPTPGQLTRHLGKIYWWYIPEDGNPC